MWISKVGGEKINKMKNELRKEYLLIRSNIKNKKDLDNKIYKKVINNEMVKKANTILIYVSLKEEIDTINLIKYFLNKKMVGVPKIVNNEMKFYYIKNINELKKGYFNILEPITNNEVTDFYDTVSITPGVCFDTNLFRIGYGKGFYDKFYHEHNVYKIGLCYKCCIVKNVFHNDFDEKVNEVITE